MPSQVSQQEKGRFDTDQREGKVTLEAEAGAMQPQAKGCQ